MDRRQTMNFLKKHYTTSIIVVFIINAFASILLMVTLYPAVAEKLGSKLTYINYYIYIALIIALIFGFLGIFTLYQAKIVKNKDLAALSAFSIAYICVIGSLYVGKITNGILTFVSTIMLLLFAFFLVFKALRIKAEFL